MNSKLWNKTPETTEIFQCVCYWSMTKMFLYLCGYVPLYFDKCILRLLTKNSNSSLYLLFARLICVSWYMIFFRNSEIHASWCIYFRALLESLTLNARKIFIAPHPHINHFFVCNKMCILIFKLHIIVHQHTTFFFECKNE